MKRILLLGLFLGIGVQLFAQGIDFKPVPFSEALRMAKTQHKMLFVDCYTSWCGPCRYMTDSIFTRQDTGDYFNKRFISVKYDIEKDEAKEFNALYTVGSFPTFWIFSPQGEVIYRMGGASLTVKEWLHRMDVAVEEGTKLEKLRQSYRKNKNEKNTQAYLEAMGNIQFGEGISELFLEQFRETSDKIDFLYQHKNFLTKHLSPVHFEKFRKALKECDGYVPEMDEIFKGVFF